MAAVGKRLAITGVDFDIVSLPHIFKIFAYVSQNSLVSVRTYISAKTSSIFGVAEFTTEIGTKKVYDTCDGCEVEGSQQVFDLSYIPDSVQLENPIEECCDSKEFIPRTMTSKKQAIIDEIPEMSSEDVGCLAGEIPENIRKETEAATLKKQQKVLDGLSGEDKESLKAKIVAEKEADESDNFVFDLNDPRFSVIFTDKDFILDASSPLFAAQRESTSILDERRRRAKIRAANEDNV